MSNQSVANSRMTFDQLMALSSVEEPRVTKDEGTPPRAPRSRTASKELSWDLDRKLRGITNPSIPTMPTKPKQPVIKKLMQPALDLGRVLPIGAIPRDPEDPRTTSKKQQSLANFSTNEMVFSHFGKDGALMAFAKQITVDSFDKEDGFAEYVSALAESTHAIGSSGTMTGVLTRLVTGLTAAPLPSLTTSDYLRYARRVIKYHTIDLDFRGKGVAEMILEVKTSKDFVFNGKSSAGVPYYTKAGIPGVLPKAVQIASRLLNAFAEGSMNTLNTERPALFAVLVKNKQDIYSIEKLEEKIRPYYVFPLHERLLYSVLQCRLKAVQFTEDADSSSAVGFSWNYGGGNRMYQWVKGRVDKGPGFYSLFYGDDQLWVVVLADGAAYVCTPDFSHMDLSLAPIWGKVAYQMWRKSYQNLDRTWDSVLKMNCHRAFTRQVIVDGALSYLFKYGLASGIPGTTKFDEVASASVNGYVKELFELSVAKISDKKALEVWLKNVSDLVKTKFGLIFKDGSMDLTQFIPDEQEYNFVFLGQTLVKVRGNSHYHYIPKPSLAKLLLSATTFKKSYRSVNIRQRSTVSKIRSLYAGGGFLYPALGEVLERYFDVQSKAGIHPLQDGEDEDFETETESDILMTIPFEGDHWPTDDWCLNLYLPPDDQVEEHTGVSVQGRQSGVIDTQLVDFTLDLDGFTSSDEETQEAKLIREEEERLIAEALNPRDWIAQEVLERVRLDKGGEPPANPKSVPTRFQAQVQPLPQGVKDAFEKTQEEARQKIREERTVSSGPKTGPKSKKKTGQVKDSHKRSGGGILEGDYDYQEEDPESD